MELQNNKITIKEMKNINIPYILVTKLNKVSYGIKHEEKIAENYFTSKGFKVIKYPFNETNLRIVREIIKEEGKSRLWMYKNGCSDLFVFNDKKYFFVECKGGYTGLSVPQISFFNKCKKLGIKFYVFKVCYPFYDD